MAPLTAAFGNNAIGAVYTTAKADANVDLVDLRGWGLAAEHKLSKRTKVCIAYADAKDKENDVKDRRLSPGSIHRCSSAQRIL